MASIFDPTNFTLSAEEVKALNECVFTDAFVKPSFGEFHLVVNGIIAKKKIAILGKLTGLFGVADGECDPASSANQIEASQKEWDPVPISDRLEQCWKDIKDTFWIYMMNKGIDRPDLTQTQFMVYLGDIITDALVEAVYRFAYFGDKNADTVANASYLTNGTNKKYFNKLDGFWVQILAIVATTPARKSSTMLTTRNAGASYATQEFNDTTDVTDKVVSKALQKMRFASDFRMRNRTDLIYIVTQSVADQYENELINANTAYTTERLENGITMLKSGNIEVYGFNLLDRIIRTYMDNGTKYLNPHRAILTTKTNLQIGTPDSTAFGEFDIFYEKKSKKNYIDVTFTMDAKVVQNELVQVSY